MSNFGFWHDMTMADPAARARVWQQMAVLNERHQRAI
jgi:hypothetical protein